MKIRILLILSLLCLRAGSLQAQDPLQERRHSVSVNLGCMTGGFRYDVMEYEPYYPSSLTLKSLYSERRDIYGKGGLVLDYSYRILKEVHVGLEYGYGQVGGELTPGYALRSAEPRSVRQHIHSLMPYAKWFVQSNPSFHYYLKAGVGPQLSTGNLESTRVQTAWELIPVGVTCGRKIFFVGELGFGTCYILRLGFGYNF